MVLQEEKQKEFTKLCEPLMEWMAKNFHLHTTVIVNATRAEFVEGIVQHVTYKFVEEIDE